jgi:hypothetical protein
MNRPQVRGVEPGKRDHSDQRGDRYRQKRSLSSECHPEESGKRKDGHQPDRRILLVEAGNSCHRGCTNRHQWVSPEALIDPIRDSPEGIF